MYGDRVRAVCRLARSHRSTEYVQIGFGQRDPNNTPALVAGKVRGQKRCFYAKEPFVCVRADMPAPHAHMFAVLHHHTPALK